MATPIRKLINRTDILRELTEVVTPLYYPKETLDKTAQVCTVC